MRNINTISRTKFLKENSIKKIDLVELGFFTSDDLINLDKYVPQVSLTEAFLKLVRQIPFAVKHFDFFKKFLLTNLFHSVLNRSFNLPNCTNLNVLEQYNLRASIVAGLKPKNLLEIGTYLGWGAAVFKFVSPKSNIYTMNPRDDRESSNPINSKNVGIICKNKGLKVIQIWADSTTYDYNKLPKIDLAYIDGNHSYRYVLSDLKNMATMKVKHILVDDYLPKHESKGGALVFSPWNESVTKAVGDFILLNYDYEAYWLKYSKLAVLTRKK